MYKLIKDPILEQTNILLKVMEGRTISIPMVNGNRYYEEYLEWLSEGNTPEAAD